MPIVDPTLLCYIKQQFLKGDSVFNRGNCFGHSCHGYSKGPGSKFPCPEFAGAFEVLNGLCVYQLHARNGKEIVHHTSPKLCGTCVSDHHSGEDCSFYTSVKDYLKGTCAFKIRAARLLDIKSDRNDLNPAEIYCLEQCKATIDVDCVGYVPVCHVVDHICGHKSKLLVKLAKGFQPEGALEANCAGCPGSCNSSTNRCQEGFFSVTDKFDFDVLTGLHTQRYSPIIAV